LINPVSNGSRRARLEMRRTLLILNCFFKRYRKRDDSSSSSVSERHAKDRSMFPCFHYTILLSKNKLRIGQQPGGLSLKRPLSMYYCTAAVFRDKPYMYMNGACTPFMYMNTQSMYRRQRCFQGPPTTMRYEVVSVVSCWCLLRGDERQQGSTHV
jgi:hypothetical protein